MKRSIIVLDVPMDKTLSMDFDKQNTANIEESKSIMNK